MYVLYVTLALVTFGPQSRGARIILQASFEVVSFEQGVLTGSGPTDSTAIDLAGCSRQEDVPLCPS